MERLWLAAASVPNQQTSRAHWKTLLGSDFEDASHWLSPTNVIASAIPSQDYRNQWLRVVEDEPFRYLAINDDVNRVSEQASGLLGRDRRGVGKYQQPNVEYEEWLCVTNC